MKNPEAFEKAVCRKFTAANKLHIFNEEGP
jgi:predicted transposase YbfD/YdcC